jgi:glucosamine-6-phosphate deaminase
MNRQEEIRTLLSLTPDEVRLHAGEHLVVCADLDRLHHHMAQSIAAEIAAHQSGDATLRLILPVGPTGQYPILARLIAEQNLSLKNCWLFFMDEYCDTDGNALDADHPLSFKGIMNDLFFDHLPDESGLMQAQIFFPDKHNIAQLPRLIDELGGIQTCYGGIGIHGHLAFNEPETNVSQLSARKVRLNDFTVTINAIRSHVGGNLENFPRYAYTLGMKEILSAQQIRLYCRNGIDLDWANTILRLALLGAAGDDYPVTHIRNHDYVIVTDEATLASPKFVL